MKKILCIFGTRPEAVKMAPVVKQLKANSKRFKVKVCVTAQHRYLLDDILRTFEIEPDYDLNIMTDNQTLFHITSTVLNRLEPILISEKPDLILVHGDTTTTFASTISSFYRKIPIGHVESGLRSYDKFNPYPEEVNRRLTDAVCDIHFCPTLTAKRALVKENINTKNIFITGNTVIDALYMILKKKHKFQNQILKELFNSQLSTLNSKLILVTAHRRENFGKPIENICKAIKRISYRFPTYSIIYPVHPNPNIKAVVYKLLNKIKNVYLIEPLNYLDFTNLLRISYLVLTDSGGLQEEAPALGKPVLVTRYVTERPEAVKSGTVKIVGPDEHKIFNEVSKLIINKKYYEKIAKSVNPYGDGFAALRTVEYIEFYFGLRSKRPAEFYVRTKKI
ncbi:MAG: UDP-N-acetylglucosamine 2-epimerase (non-hydrolyzing) [Elusimicrobia bacterium]|nr:UDP-N-acetylglucosamine 2-epimerase (non-hydrolyzing) [Elusimicrobiota bacterium]